MAALPKVLVIDDEPMLLRAVERMLQRDYTVRPTPDAATAIEWLKSGEEFDAILCDMRMPHMSGIVFYQKLLEVAPKQVAGLVFLTGDCMSGTQADFFAGLPNAVINKPFVASTLREVVALTVRETRARAA